MGRIVQDRGARALVALILLMAASLVWLVDPYFESMWDAVLYVLTTRSLLAGDGYMVYGEPFHLRPPGFPALLAPVIGIFGTDFLALNVFTSLLGILAVALVFVWFRPRLGIAVAFALCLSLWINPQYQSLCNTALSDNVGLAAVLGCFLLDKSARERPTAVRDAVLGVAIGVAAYLRTVAFLAVPAIVLSRLLHARSVAAAQGRAAMVGRLALIAVLPFLLQSPWTLWKRFHPPPQPANQYGIYSYEVAQWHEDPTDPESPRLPLAKVLERVPTRVTQCITSLGSRLPKATLHGILMPEEIERVRDGNRRPLGYPLGWIAVACLVAVALRRRDPGNLFALGNLAVLLVYFDFDDRVLLPTYVFALAAFLEVLVAALSRFAPAGRARLAAVTLVAVMGISDAFPRNDRSFVAERNRTHAEVARILDESYPGERVAAALGHKLAVFLERPVWFLEVTTAKRGLAGARAVLRRHRAHLVVLTGPEIGAEMLAELEPFLDRHAKLVLQTGDVRVFEFLLRR